LNIYKYYIFKKILVLHKNKIFIKKEKVNMEIIINENQLKELIRKMNNRDILSEEIKNRQLVNNLFEKWKTGDPNLTIEETERLINEFSKVKNNLKPGQPQVNSFLNRYDGNGGFVKFNVNDLKDITKYNFFQIDFLIEQYSDVDQEDEDNDDIGVMSNPTEKIYDNSEKLWNGEKNLIISDGDFRVYDIPNQITSIKFGYYVKKINTLQKSSSSPWCVTWATNSNMWGSYRQRGYSFYFVIDESKNKENDKYYLGALIKDNSPFNTNGYRLVSVKNDGEIEMSWDQIVKIYPKLKEQQDLIVKKEYDGSKELKITSIIGQISEYEGSTYEFKKQSRLLKKRFIELNNSLHKPESWMSLDDGLRKIYILNTTRDNAKNKFDNYNLISEIRKNQGNFKLLHKKLTDLGFKEGITYLLGDMLKTRFNILKTEFTNKHISILQHKSTKEMGIFDYLKGDWLEKNNIRYEPFYNKRQTKLYKYNDEDKLVRYIVEEYTINGTIEDKTFYGIYDSSDKSGAYQSHFMSRKAFLRLLSDNPEINLEGNEPMNQPDPNDKTLKNKPETDINEFKRRY
jgi:hypothetical protein